MKIAGGILGLLLGLLVLLQSCTVATTASLVGHEAAGAGAAGVLVGLLFFVGGAFAFGLPIVSTIAFVLAALLAFLAASEFPDMGIWGGVAVALAALCFFAWRSGRPRAKTERT